MSLSLLIASVWHADFCPTALSRRENQSRISLLGNVIQVPAIVAEPARVRHEHPLLAFDVRAQVPRRLRLREQRPVRGLRHMLGPGLGSVTAWLDFGDPALL